MVAHSSHHKSSKTLQEDGTYSTELHHPLIDAQSSGQAEHFVQTIKNSLTKAMEWGEDLHLAILSYITTPLYHSLPSPTELLNSRKFRCLLPLQMQQQEHTHQYRKMMQHQKHQQVKHYNKSTRDLPNLKAEDAVYVQLVPNARRWIPGTIVEILSASSYKVKTIKGGIYVRNRKFIRIRYTDLRQSLETIPKGTVQSEGTTYTWRSRRTTRKPQTHRVNELYTDRICTQKIHIICKDFISSLSYFSLILSRLMLQAFSQREREGRCYKMKDLICL